MPSDAAAIRTLAGRALVGGLCVAAIVAVVALLTGSFDDTEVRVILTSIGFAATSGTGAAGAVARLRPSQALATIGGVTVLASGATFALLAVGLWTESDSDTLWRAFGCAGVVAIAGSHASLVLGARRRSDNDAIRVLAVASLAFGAFDTVGSILPIVGLVDEVSDDWARLFGATLVMLILTSVLPPILRRLERAGPTPAGDTTTGNGRPDGAPEFLATAVIEIVEKIEVLNADPGNRSPEIRTELRRLKTLAKSYEI